MNDDEYIFGGRRMMYGSPQWEMPVADVLEKLEERFENAREDARLAEGVADELGAALMRLLKEVPVCTKLGIVKEALYEHEDGE